MPPPAYRHHRMAAVRQQRAWLASRCSVQSSTTAEPFGGSQLLCYALRFASHLAGRLATMPPPVHCYHIRMASATRQRARSLLNVARSSMMPQTTLTNPHQRMILRHWLTTLARQSNKALPALLPPARYHSCGHAIGLSGDVLRRDVSAADAKNVIAQAVCAT